MLQRGFKYWFVNFIVVRNILTMIWTLRWAWEVQTIQMDILVIVSTIITLPIAALLVPSVGEMIEFYCTNLEYKESYFSKFIMLITTKKMENKIWNKYCLICVSLGYMLANVGIIIYVIFTLNEVNFWITQLLAVLSGVFGAALMVEVRNYLYSHQTKRVRILDVVFLNKFILRSNIENK